MITQYEGQVAEHERARRAVQDELKELAEQLRRARHWLAEHGQHPPACEANKGRPCDCGLDELKRGQ